MRILITGVHSTPAFAVIDELRSRSTHEIYYVGQKHTILFNNSISAEYEVALTKNITFINFFAGKLSKTLSVSSLIWWLRIPFGYIQAIYIILKIKPRVIVTFGAHVGVPIATIGAIFKIPVIVHEQTIIMTRATKAISVFASVICYSWSVQKSKYILPKYVFTGNPIRKEVFQNNIQISFDQQNKKTIFVFCGNQGAHYINEILIQGLDSLSEKYNLIIQTGKNTFGDFDKLMDLAHSLNQSGIKVIIKDYIFPHEVGSYYNKADLVVCRAGINSISEIASLGKIALTIPHPQTAGNEQYLNAKLLADIGTAKLIEQKELTSAILIQAIDEIFENYSNYTQNIQKAKELVKMDAEKEIADIIDKYLYIT